MFHCEYSRGVIWFSDIDSTSIPGSGENTKKDYSKIVEFANLKNIAMSKHVSYRNCVESGRKEFQTVQDIPHRRGVAGGHRSVIAEPHSWGWLDTGFGLWQK